MSGVGKVTGGRGYLGPPQRMNFLGHLYLAGQDPLAVVGNFMADAVKGRDLSRFPEPVQQGIRLHRLIDTFTDAHPVQRVGRERLRAHAGRYSGVVMDLFFDHLLAVDWDHWHTEPLPDFAQRMYALLQEHAHLMPDRTRDMLPYMVRYDWLTSYATTEGLARALHGLSNRVPEGEVMRGAERVLVDHFDDYRNEFGIFLPELTVHLSEQA